MNFIAASNQNIVYSDPHIIVASKPSGISTVPFEKKEPNTFVDIIRKELRKKNKQRNQTGTNRSRNDWLGIVHRIDKDTSGLLVFTRSSAAQTALTHQFRRHLIDRTYLALVYGDIKQSQTVRTWLLPNRGDSVRGSMRYKNQIYYLNAKDQEETLRKQLRVPNLAKFAVTHFRPLQHFLYQGKIPFTLIECRLETGRTHQIRIHLSELGNPVWGDSVYTPKEILPISKKIKELGAPHLMLHAQTLGFLHPIYQKNMSWSEEPPKEFANFIALLTTQ